MDNDIYIRVLEFARKRGSEGFSYKEFKEEFGEDKEAIFVSALTNSSFSHMRGKGEGVGTFDSYYILSFEGRFKLFEYFELKAAQRSSLVATRFAMAALVVSVIATIFSIYYSNLQISSPNRLDQLQLKALSSSLSKSIESDINAMQQTVNSELKIISGTIIKLDAHNQQLNMDAAKNAAPVN